MFTTESTDFTITPPPALDRMAILLADVDLSRVDAVMLADAKARVTVLSHKYRATQSRAVGSGDLEDLVTTATYLACHLMTSEGRGLSEACRLATWRVGKRLGEILTRVDATAIDDVEDDRLEIALGEMPRPDRIARTTQWDRRIEIIDSLRDRQRELLAVSGSGRWQRGRPSAVAMLEALGETASGPARARMTLAVTDALADARAGRRYILAREARQAGRTRVGASPEVWALAHAQDREANPHAVDGHAQVGNRAAPESGPASPVVIRCQITGDLWLQMPGSGTLTAIADDAAEWTLARRTDDVSPFTPVVPLPESVDGVPPTTRQIAASARAARRQIARDEAFVATVDPTRERATSRSSAIPGVTPGMVWGSGVAAYGRPYRKPASGKRKKDGAIGSPMTRG